MTALGDKLLSWSIQDMQPARPYRKPPLDTWGGKLGFLCVGMVAGAALLTLAFAVTLLIARGMQ